MKAIDTIRASHKHYARVMLQECKARRHQRQFCQWLLNSAINATREALYMSPLYSRQPDLFGRLA
jgi:hypothetical protein